MAKKELLELLKERLTILQRQQADCVSATGFVISNKRYKYKKLMDEIKRVNREISTILKIRDDSIDYR